MNLHVYIKVLRSKCVILLPFGIHKSAVNDHQILFPRKVAKMSILKSLNFSYSWLGFYFLYLL